MASASYKISGVEPADYDLYPELHEEFWKAVVRFGLIEKDHDLARGVGADGAELAELRPSTIAHRKSAMGPADPHAPPLIPAHGLSRSRSLLAGRAHAKERYALFYWRFDPVSGGPWGKILAIHRKGGKNLARRNVIGISPAGLRNVRANVWHWWEQRKRGPAPLPQVPLPQIPAGVKFLVRDVPKYQPKNPANAVPKANRRIGQIEINGHHYTLQGGSAAQIRRGIANKTFSGFRRASGLKGLGGVEPPPPKPVAPKPARPAKPAPKPVESIVPTTAIDRARAYAESKGFEVKVDAAVFTRIYGEDAKRTLGFYSPKKDAIWLNPDHPSWADPAKFFADPKWGNWFSSSHPEHAIFHEVGHGLHARAIGPDKFRSHRDKFDSAEDREIAKRVGKYATLNPVEFVAEVYAGRTGGKRYDNEVLALYDKLGGPPE